MIREDTSNYGLGAPSISVKYHRRLATALTFSLEDPSTRHINVTFNLLNKQIAHLTFLSTKEGTNLHIKSLLNHCMRARQLPSIHSSKLLLMKHGETKLIVVLAQKGRHIQVVEDCGRKHKCTSPEERDHVWMGAVENDVLLILYAISITQATRREGIVNPGHCFNSLILIQLPRYS